MIVKDKIIEFQGKYRFLSNFYKAEIWHDGIYYPSTEHAYQASKTMDLNERFKISKIESPGDAKKYTRTLEVRSDWNDLTKKHVMYEINLIKYIFHDDLKNLLLKTYPKKLQEGNNWGDTYWGIDLKTGKGENNLGKTLMSIRYILSGLK